jgi:hypothetical protein
MCDRLRESNDGRSSDAARQEADSRDAHDWRCGRDRKPEELEKNETVKRTTTCLVLYYPPTKNDPDLPL